MKESLEGRKTCDFVRVSRVVGIWDDVSSTCDAFCQNLRAGLRGGGMDVVVLVIGGRW